MRPLCARCHLSLGLFYYKHAYPEPARVALTPIVVAMFHAMEIRLWLSQAEAALAQIE